MLNLLLNSVLFVWDVLCAISSYNSAHYVWACILSACGGALFMITALTFIDRN